jgi:hypothetical protein
LDWLFLSTTPCRKRLVISCASPGDKSSNSH